MTEGQTTILGSIDEVCVIVLYPQGVTEYTALATARELIQEEQA